MYGHPVKEVSAQIGPSERAIARWYKQFIETGRIDDEKKTAYVRYPDNVYEFILEFIEKDPRFFIEELQAALMKQFPELQNVSIPTICRAQGFAFVEEKTI